MQAKAMSGKSQFPFLVDPNTGKQMLESDAIITYLWNEYGDGKVGPFPASAPGACKGCMRCIVYSILCRCMQHVVLILLLGHPSVCTRLSTGQA